MAPRARIILHGKHADDPDLRSAVSMARSHGHQLDVRATWEAGDAEHIAAESCKLGISDLVVGGGDGTINEVVNGLTRACQDGRPWPRLGLLPLGTANDLADSAGLHFERLSDALEFAVSGPVHHVDLILHEDGRSFLNLATAGFGAHVTAETPELLKRALGAGAYLLTGITKIAELEGYRAKVSADDFQWQGRFLALALGNGRQAGGGRQMCPNAFIDDGLLDLAILPEPRPDHDGESDPDSGVLEGLRTGAAAANQTVERARSAWVRIDCEDPVTLNLDGESVEGKSFVFRAQRGRVPLRLPRESQLLSNSD